MATEIRIAMSVFPKERLIERIAHRLGTTTTRCPYCNQWDPRPGTHLDRKHPPVQAPVEAPTDLPRSWRAIAGPK